MKVSNIIKPLILALGSISMLASCATPSQMYWDHKVKELCEKDGGVTVYEKVELTKEEYDALPKYENKYVTVLSRKGYKENQGYFYESKDTVIKESDPSVWRTDILIKRKSDEKVIAKYASFRRSGGDLIPVDHPSTYACPDPKQTSLEINNIFSVKGETK